MNSYSSSEHVWTLLRLLNKACEISESCHKKKNSEKDIAQKRDLFREQPLGLVRVHAGPRPPYGGLRASYSKRHALDATVALAGDASRADALGADLARRFPEDTVVQFNYFPTIHAQLALSRCSLPSFWNSHNHASMLRSVVQISCQAANSAGLI